MKTKEIQQELKIIRIVSASAKKGIKERIVKKVSFIYGFIELNVSQSVVLKQTPAYYFQVFFYKVNLFYNTL